MLEGAVEVRARLEDAWQIIRRVKDEQRRLDLEEAYAQAELPWVQTVEAGHGFVFDRVEERLAASRERATALLERLANPVER
jgi:hypothetical protein